MSVLKVNNHVLHDIFLNSPEIHEVPGVYEGWWHTLSQGEPQVLEMDPHGARTQPCLLGSGDQVHWELLTLLQLVT